MGLGVRGYETPFCIAHNKVMFSSYLGSFGWHVMGGRRAKPTPRRRRVKSVRFCCRTQQQKSCICLRFWFGRDLRQHLLLFYTCERKRLDEGCMFSTPTLTLTLTPNLRCYVFTYNTVARRREHLSTNPFLSFPSLCLLLYLPFPGYATSGRRASWGRAFDAHPSHSHLVEERKSSRGVCGGRSRSTKNGVRPAHKKPEIRQRPSLTFLC